MERQVSVGLFWGFAISGVACLMISFSQQLGIGLLVVACILGLLFVNPKSPIRRRWWSVSGKLAIQVVRNEDIELRVGEGRFTVYIGFVAMPSMQVDKISLKIGRMRLWASDWEPREVAATEAWYVSFVKPPQLSTGTYDSNVFAHTRDGHSKSKRVRTTVSSESASERRE